MRILNQIWLGTEASFHDLRAMEDKYFGVKPVAFHDPNDGPGIDPDFGVARDRIGLNLLERVGSYAIIKVHGTLTNNHKWWHSYFSGEITSYEAIQDALAIVRDDESIETVVMDYATGGGLVKGLDVTSQHIEATRKTTKVVSHTDSSVFSAGYWLACAGEYVTASRMAEVGSIGTLIVTFAYANPEEKQGVSFRVFRAGEFKALGNPYEKLTEEAAAYIQSNLDKTNDFFLDHVVKHRNLPMSDRKRWGEGKTFFAEEALRVGLIDRVATLAEVVGSGASQTSTSDNRRFEMKISDQKLAQIAAGADPKDVLTAEELEFYTAQNDAPELTADEPEGDKGEQLSQDQAPEANADATEKGADASMLQLTREVGRLEAKLEVSEAKAAELEGQLQAKDADTKALMDVAQVALSNMCVALGKPKEAPATATALVTAFNDMRTEMGKRFNTGQASNLTVEDPTKSVVGNSTSYRNK